MTFPNLRDRKIISIDLETHDPDLRSKGIGVRRDGYPVGYAVATEDWEEYFPTRHNEGFNHSPGAVEKWLRDELKSFRGELVFANGLYDLDYMADAGIHIPTCAIVRDIQIAEPLLDDNRRRYNLDSLARQYLGRGKSEQPLIDLYGKKFKQHMAGIPSDLVADYAKDDARETFDIFALQRPKLQADGLWDVFEMESALTPMLLYMRRLGVCVNLEETHKRSNDLFIRQRGLERALEGETGVPFYSDKTTTVWKPTALAAAFDGANLNYPRTPMTKAPSFRKQWLEQHPAELAQRILEIRSLDKMRNTFLQSAILGSHIDGRIHTTFNQVRNDEGGAVTGRFSSCYPNLQQVPSRDEILAPLIRGLFIPEEGQDWFCYDWSQIEYRLLVHYAYIDRASGSRLVYDQYINDPATDYHKIVQDLVKEKLGRDIPRKPIKNVNFGLIYGMGKIKLGAMLDMEEGELNDFLIAYDEAIPFAREMRGNVTGIASRRGFVKTILGRRRRFEQWESKDWGVACRDRPVSKDEAAELYNKIHYKIVKDDEGNEIEVRAKQGIRRAGTYKALNALIQGSAADMMKEAMVQIWKAGLTTGTGGPLAIHLTVHDELDGSVPRTAEGREALAELKHIMETALELVIPVRAEGGTGPSWAEVK